MEERNNLNKNIDINTNNSDIDKPHETNQETKLSSVNKQEKYDNNEIDQNNSAQTDKKQEQNPQ